MSKTSQPAENRPATVPPLPPDLPAEAVAALQEVGYLEPDRLHVGDRVPPLTLQMLDTSVPVVLGVPYAAQPTALIFGSYT